jgi:thiamine biosynthesis lipoprotein
MLAGIAGALVSGAVPAHAAGARRIGGQAFGTWWRITLPSRVNDRRAAAAVRGVIASVDAAMSPFRPGSEVSVFNATDSRDWQPCSRETCAVVRQSLEVARLSAGAFDPTVGPVVGRYGFGPIRQTGSGGESYRELVAGRDRIRKLAPRATLDLCGIAKGHAVDRMAAALESLHVADFLIEFGGEVLARGTHPDGRPWRVGVERPVPGRTAFQRIVRLIDGAIATSGDVANSYVIAGRRFSHIIDPRRREPVDNALASVSVLMPTASAADALATALMALGQDAGPALAERERISSLFLVRDGGALREIMTGAFPGAVLADEGSR